MDIGLAKVIDGDALRAAFAGLLPGSRIAVVNAVTEWPAAADVTVVRQLRPDSADAGDPSVLRFPAGLLVQARLLDGVDAEAWLGELARRLASELDTATLVDATSCGGRPGQWLVWRNGAAMLVAQRDDDSFVPLPERPEATWPSIELAAVVQHGAVAASPATTPGPPVWYRALLLLALAWSLMLLSGYSLGQIVLGAKSLVQDTMSAGDATRLFASYATSTLTAIPTMLAGACGVIGTIALLAARRWAWLPLLSGALAILWPLLVWFLAWALWRAADDFGATLLLAQIVLSALTMTGLPALWLLAHRRGWLAQEAQRHAARSRHLP